MQRIIFADFNAWNNILKDESNNVNLNFVKISFTISKTTQKLKC